MKMVEDRIHLKKPRVCHLRNLSLSRDKKHKISYHPPLLVSRVRKVSNSHRDRLNQTQVGLFFCVFIIVSV
jgi:hypothetical protein